MCGKHNEWQCSCLISSIAMQFSDVVHHMEEVQKLCHEQAVVKRGLKCVQLVYGSAGECMFLVTLCYLTAAYSTRAYQYLGYGGVQAYTNIML